VYPSHAPQPLKEEYLFTGILEPTNEGYAIAKIAGMKLCEKIFAQYNRCFISCMPCNLYGVGDNINPETSHVIPALVRRMHEAVKNNASEITIWGSGNVRREFLYVDDLADAIVWLLDSYEEEEFINVGSGHDITIRDLAFLIKDLVGFKGELVFDTTKPDGMQQRLLDISKITERGWKPKVDLEKGLVRFYDWYKTTV
jgi:GDP-L-fucose synthase